MLYRRQEKTLSRVIHRNKVLSLKKALRLRKLIRLPLSTIPN